MQLKVAGWTYPRDIFFEANTLKMEIARVACRHCPTCSKRVESVGARLKEANANWHWETAMGGLYFAVELSEKPAQVQEYLSELLGRSVRVS